MLHCIFGEKQAGASYRTRPGAYLIAVSGAQIASIRTPKGFFLPGGGVEPGETHEACILRECLEETGFLVQVGELLGSAESYLLKKLELFIQCSIIMRAPFWNSFALRWN